MHAATKPFLCASTLVLAVLLSQVGAIALTESATANNQPTNLTIRVCPSRRMTNPRQNAAKEYHVNTLHEAIKLIDEIKGAPSGASDSTSTRVLHVAVVLCGGIHMLDGHPIRLQRHHRNISFSAEDGEQPIISGGVQIPEDAWRPWPGRQGVYEVNLAELGILDTGTMVTGGLKDCQNNRTELFFDGRAMIIARYPNVAANGTWQWAHVVASSSSSSFQFDPKEVQPGEWTDEKDPWMHGYWVQDWSDSFVQIKSISTANNTIFMGQGALQPKAGGRWMGINLLSQLDAPGEYYIDRSQPDNSTLYFFPPSQHTRLSYGPVVRAPGPQRMVEADLSSGFISMAEHCIELRGSSSLSFSGISFQHARGTAVVATDVTDIVFEDCDFSNNGGNGTVIDGYRNVVSNCTSFHCACMGLSVTGGNRTSLQPGNNTVLGNTVSQYARWKRTYQAGIFWAGVGNTYSDNSVSFGPHTGILGGGNEADQRGGNDCVFESNHISDVAYETSDTGAFYTCGQDGQAWINRGNRAVNNTFTRIRCIEPTKLGFPSVQALYLDDQMSGWLVENNTFVDCQLGMLVGGGRKTLVRGNTFISCDTAIHFDNRGMGWQKSSCQPPNGSDYVEAQAFRQLPGWERYNITLEMPCVPVYNQFVENKACNCTTFSTVTPQQAAQWHSLFANNTEHC